MTLPTFFVAGAPKAGTDELFYALEQHPQVYVSPLKEPCYFSSEVRPENFEPNLREQAERNAEATRRYIAAGMEGKRFGGVVSDIADYERLFARANGAKAIGEGSVCYLWSASAPGAIAAVVPNARVIIVLMDPAERAFRQYLKSVSDGTVTHSFRDHIRAAMSYGPELSIYHPFLEFGNYFEQVRRYLDRFPADRIHLSLYEDSVRDFPRWFSGILAFLEVEASFTPQPVHVPSKPHLPRFPMHSERLRKVQRSARALLPSGFKAIAKRVVYRRNLPSIEPQDRRVLINYYRNDIVNLQELIGRDLSAWLR